MKSAIVLIEDDSFEKNRNVRAKEHTAVKRKTYLFMFHLSIIYGYLISAKTTLQKVRFRTLQ
jgi:hypothetical protein